MTATITLTRSTEYQIMRGWEGVLQVGYDPDASAASFTYYQDSIIQMLVDDLGISRVRLEVKSGNESTTDWYNQWVNGIITFATYLSHFYATINDNADPDVFLGGSEEGGGWQWTYLDRKIEDIVIPMRTWCAARGESLWVTLHISDDDDAAKRVGGNINFNSNPDEVGEFVLAHFLHMDNQYGFVPDAVAVVNEPDVNSWSGTQVGNALISVKARLDAAGYTNVVYIGPASSAMGTGHTTFLDIVATGFDLNIYDSHYYGTKDQTLRQQMASDAAGIGADVHMGEYITLDIDDVYDLIIDANVGSVQQYVLGYPTVDDGAQYVLIDDAVVYDPKLAYGATAKLLRSYFRWVRPSAQRFLASSDSGNFKPLAWENPDGTYVVVVRANASDTIVVQDLPDGTYGINYSTDAGSFNNNLSDQVVSGGSDVSFSMPAIGIVTIYGRKPYNSASTNTANSDVAIAHTTSGVSTTVYTRRAVSTTVYTSVVMV